MTRVAQPEAPAFTFAAPSRTITGEDVAGFAALTGDHHPQHTDPDWAASSLFGEQVAHGLLVLACAVGQLEFDPARVVALRRVRDVVFKRPVAFGASIHPVVETTGVKVLDERHALVEVDLRACDADGRLLMRARVEVLWRTGEEAAP